MTSRSNAANAAASGFTLIEMIVVIVVLGLVLALLSQYGPMRNRWVQTKGAGQAIAAAMNQDRGRAIASGQPVPLRLPPLPGWLVVEVAAPSGGIVFEPDGSATGGTIALDGGGRRLLIAVDWLTGRVRVDAP